MTRMNLKSFLLCERRQTGNTMQCLIPDHFEIRSVAVKDQGLGEETDKMSQGIY